MVTDYLFNIGIAISQLGNAIAGGDPDETISSRTGKRLRDGRLTPWARLVIFITGKKHVLGAIEADRGDKDSVKSNM